MSNKNYPGNESFTITLTDLWYFSRAPVKHIIYSTSECIRTVAAIYGCKIGMFGLPCFPIFFFCL